jgi:hypothetical protein
VTYGTPHPRGQGEPRIVIRGGYGIYGIYSYYSYYSYYSRDCQVFPMVFVKIFDLRTSMGDTTYRRVWISDANLVGFANHGPLTYRPHTHKHTTHKHTHTHKPKSYRLFVYPWRRQYYYLPNSIDVDPIERTHHYHARYYI